MLLCNGRSLLTINFYFFDICSYVIVEFQLTKIPLEIGTPPHKGLSINIAWHSITFWFCPFVLAVRIQQKCSQNVVRMYSVCSQYVAGMQPECSQNEAKMQSECSQNVVRMWLECSQNAVRMQPDCSQNVVRMQPL